MNPIRPETAPEVKHGDGDSFRARILRLGFGFEIRQD
jgi:hypothetical protein